MNHCARFSIIRKFYLCEFRKAEATSSFSLFLLSRGVSLLITHTISNSLIVRQSILNSIFSLFILTSLQLLLNRFQFLIKIHVTIVLRSYIFFSYFFFFYYCSIIIKNSRIFKFSREHKFFLPLTISYVKNLPYKQKKNHFLLFHFQRKTFQRIHKITLVDQKILLKREARR